MSKASAEAFARYYVDLINYAIVTGNTDGMRRRAAQRCATCAAVAKEIEGVYADDGRMVSEGWTVLTGSADADAAKRPVVDLRIRITKALVFDSPSATPSKSAATTGDLRLTLETKKSRWHVQRMDAS